MSTEPHPDDQQRSPAGAADSLRSSLHGVAESAGAAHRDRRRQGLGLPASSLVATASRRRRRFTAGVAATSAAAVAAVAFSGVALAGLPDGGTGLEPADWGVPYGLCGTTVTPDADEDGLLMKVSYAAPAIAADGRWTATAEVRDVLASDDERRGGHLSDIVLLVVQDGVVVGLQAEPVAMRGTPVDLGADDVVRTPIDVGLVGCDPDAVTPLAPGSYELYVQQTWAPQEFSTDEDAWITLVDGPLDLTVAAAGTADPAAWTFPECGTQDPDEVPAGPLTLSSDTPASVSTTDPFIDFTTTTGAVTGGAVFTEVDVALALVRDGRVVATARPDEVGPARYQLGVGVTSYGDWTGTLVDCADPISPVEPGEYTVWPAVKVRLTENTDRDGNPLDVPLGERWYLGEPRPMTVTGG